MQMESRIVTPYTDGGTNNNPIHRCPRQYRHHTSDTKTVHGILIQDRIQDDTFVFPKWEYGQNTQGAQMQHYLD